MADIILHGMWRSSASYRVRIALNLKELSYEQKNYKLLENEHKSPEFLAKNPQGLIPALEVGGKTLTQSLSIIEYLDVLDDGYLLLPKDPIERARVQAIAYSIACEIHPLNNLRVMGYLKSEMGHDQQDINKWYHHWIREEFKALETRLTNDPETGEFCHGDKPGFAECFLIPQIYNAERFNCDLSDFPKIMEINRKCLEIAAFENAVPEKQPDAVN